MFNQGGNSNPVSNALRNPGMGQQPMQQQAPGMQPMGMQQPMGQPQMPQMQVGQMNQMQGQPQQMGRGPMPFMPGYGQRPQRPMPFMPGYGQQQPQMPQRTVSGPPAGYQGPAPVFMPN